MYSGNEMFGVSEPVILDLFKVMCYELYDGKSPFFHRKSWDNMFFIFSESFEKL